MIRQELSYTKNGAGRRSSPLDSLIAPNLAHSEQIRLIHKMRDAGLSEADRKEYRERFYKANMGLVMKAACRAAPLYNLQVEDLISYGFEGIMLATERFDPDLGFRYSTYATWWVNRCVYRGARTESRVVPYSLPHAVFDLGLKIPKKTRELTLELGRDPSEEEVAKALKVSVAKYRHIQNILAPHASLNEKLPNQESSVLELQDMLIGTWKAAECSQSELLVDNLLSLLNRREKEIIELTVYEELNRSAAIVKLGISPGAFRKSLSSAIGKLTSYYASEAPI